MLQPEFHCQNQGTVSLFMLTIFEMLKGRDNVRQWWKTDHKRILIHKVTKLLFQYKITIVSAWENEKNTGLTTISRNVVKCSYNAME